MKARLILCVGFMLTAVFCATAAVNDGMIQVRRFTVHGRAQDKFSGMDEKSLMKLFTDVGVEWPQGSSIKYVRISNSLVVKNSAENLDNIMHILIGSGAILFQVEIRLDYIEYDMKDIERLAKEGELSTEPLLKLWRDGSAKLLFSPCVLTQSGQQATIKAVDEYIYPTEFTVIEVQSGTSKSRPGDTPPPPAAPPPAATPQAVEPGSFETREVGVILDVLPETSPDSRLVNITISPETVAPPLWKDYGYQVKQKDGSISTLPMEQPFFNSHSLQTNILIAPGTTLMIGGGVNNSPEEKTTFVFITVRLLGPDGTEIKNN
jgi:type II secretory pathway component GspD/PulD (secretin)